MMKSVTLTFVPDGSVQPEAVATTGPRRRLDRRRPRGGGPGCWRLQDPDDRVPTGPGPSSTRSSTPPRQTQTQTRPETSPAPAAQGIPATPAHCPATTGHFPDTGTTPGPRRRGGTASLAAHQSASRWQDPLWRPPACCPNATISEHGRSNTDD